MAYNEATRTFTRTYSFVANENTQNNLPIRQADLDASANELAAGIDAVAKAIDQDTISFGAVADGVTDDYDALVLARNAGMILLPDGVTRMGSVLSADDGTVAWAGIRGLGAYRSILKLTSASYLLVQNRVPGGPNDGVRHWPTIIAEDMTIDGDGVAPRGIAIGTLAEAGETDINDSSNGGMLKNVTVMDTAGAGFEYGFNTKTTTLNCIARGNLYGFYSDTNSNSTAADVNTFLSIAAQGNSRAGFVDYSENVNIETLAVIGALINDNDGFGMVFKSETAKHTAVLTNVHIEDNGTAFDPTANGGAGDVIVATPVAVKDVLTAEPVGLYADNYVLQVNGGMITNSAITLKNGSYVEMNGGCIQTGGNGPANFLTPLRNCDEDCTFSMGGGATFSNPCISTNAFLAFHGQIHIEGGTNDMSFISGRLAAPPVLKGLGLMTDPQFKLGLGGLTVSSPATYTIGSNVDPDVGGRSMNVQYAAASGSGFNNNAVMFGLPNLAADDYIALSFYAKVGSGSTVLRANTNSAQYGNNRGQPIITVDNKRRRFICLWRDHQGVATTSNILGIYPESNDGPLVKFSGMEIAVGSFTDVMPVLQGGIGQSPTSFTFEDSVNSSVGTSTATFVTMDIPVTGAQVGDTVDYIDMDFNSNAAFPARAWVNTNGNVRIRVNNPGGNVDVGIYTVSMKITKAPT